jgi:hypothetical protein
MGHPMRLGWLKGKSNSKSNRRSFDYDAQRRASPLRMTLFEGERAKFEGAIEDDLGEAKSKEPRMAHRLVYLGFRHFLNTA